ncbi:E3 SUMO-protein ligase ZBED1-like [Drosophila bipectinata]|uniref:E3 SUMO-protein ligase ZBED1-like n=1 Tax=Drosophila bipectinata TaxID=42026 RepID=UPI0038B2C95C
MDPLNHNAENIAASVRNVLSKWNLETKVNAIVTDNASAMIKSCEILQKRHFPCFAHCLNLVVQDCLEENSIKHVLTKCKKIVKFFKCSTIAYEKFKQAQGDNAYSLIQEVSTRWNSAFKMVERILATKEFLSPVLLSLSRAPDPLTADDIELLEDIQTILAPFDYVTTQCSSSSKVTSSLIVPLTNGLVEGLNDQFGRLKTVDGQQACRFLQDRARIRLFPFEERSTARLATIMDPRFKKEGFRSPFNAEQAAVLLERSLSTNTIAGADAEEGDSQETAVEPPVTPNAAEPLLKFLSSNIEKKKRTKKVDVILVMRHYFEGINSDISSNPLEYWRSNESDQPALAKLAKKALCVPATSTESERMFSKAGQIISERRSSLKPNIVDQLLFINKNWWITESNI